MKAMNVLIAQDLDQGSASRQVILSLALASTALGTGMVLSSQARAILKDQSIVHPLPLRDALIKAGCKPMIHANQEDR